MSIQYYIRLCVTFICILLLPVLVSAQEYKTITTIGLSAPVCDGGVDTISELQTYIQNNQNDFEKILVGSGWTGDPKALISRMLDGEFTESSLPVGTKFEWMGARYKSSGNVVVDDYIRWGGKEPLEVFSIKIEHENNLYTLALPKSCCNLALLTEVEPIMAIVEPVSQPEPEVEPAKFIPYVAPFIGFQNREYEDNTWNMRDDDSFAAGGLVGVMYPINSATHFLAQVGYLFDFDESDNDGIFADLGINYKITERTFIGGGMGYWYIDSDIDTENGGSFSLFGQAGYQIRDNLQWYVEARAYANGLESQSYLTGIRYLFK